MKLKPERESRLLRRAMTTFGLSLLVAPILYCSSGTIHYTPLEDDRVMSRVLGIKAANGVELAVCEDDSRAGEEEEKIDEGCVYDHIVRDGGEGIPRERDAISGGCGGCPFSAIAFVKASLTGPGLEEPMSLAGSVNVGSSYDANPYDPPYYIDLSDEHGTMRLGGSIDAKGHLTIEHWNLPMDANLAPELHASGEAQCKGAQ